MHAIRSALLEEPLSVCLRMQVLVCVSGCVKTCTCDQGIVYIIYTDFHWLMLAASPAVSAGSMRHSMRPLCLPVHSEHPPPPEGWPLYNSTAVKKAQYSCECLWNASPPFFVVLILEAFSCRTCSLCPGTPPREGEGSPLTSLSPGTWESGEVWERAQQTSHLVARCSIN